MTRKSVFLVLGLVVGGSVGIAAILAVLIFHEPEFYRRSAIPPGEQRVKWSREFVTELNDLINGIINYKTWGGTFTEQQINSYFEEDFERLGPAERASFFPEGCSAPRVAVEGDRIRIGFSY